MCISLHIVKHMMGKNGLFYTEHRYAKVNRYDAKVDVKQLPWDVV